MGGDVSDAILTEIASDLLAEGNLTMLQFLEKEGLFRPEAVSPNDDLARALWVVLVPICLH